ncbi:phosphotransferase enzyme family protein [Streptantibioticus rubrisoli]|uniref:Aminoglycoside phosphotransferase family protein n=1 Tax=Streptantibioticus rubrisoli TaxID=1387313 RepID=A0ABT1PKZ4_9ACTN|nr:aminoglycoside phosphotransferase family protein [Streptantibioticus rubrisoli]MCQ4046039.1 aminoglycoside phosphotransferase family protein [Streptantibioticus rubrisoli]
MPSGAGTNEGAGFTSAVAARVMTEACRRTALNSDAARLLRFGENAIFRLASHPVVVRIARSTDYLPSVRNEVHVSRWLAREGLPAARVVDDIEQPLIIDGRPVTFWHLIEEGDRKATYGELGAILRDLHSLELPAGLKLPSYSPFGRTALRIDAVTGISEDDRQFLRKRGHELRDRLAELRFESMKGPVHGDAHVQNLMVDACGQVILIDFEGFCYDYPEWDLMVTATEHDSLGWQTPEQYAEFVAAYGRDLREWAGFPTLRGIQEFQMTTWLMQNVAESPEAAEEYARRIASLRDDDAPRHWHPG